MTVSRKMQESTVCAPAIGRGLVARRQERLWSSSTFGVVAALAFCGFTPFAWGQALEDAKICAGTDGSAEQRISACTRAITSGQLSQPSLSRAFYNRGIEWQDKWDVDRAIADYNEAIRINPQYGLAYVNRGNRWADKNDFERAIADYNAAIRLDPQDAEAYYNRSSAWKSKGDTERATADYNEAIRLNPRLR